LLATQSFAFKRQKWLAGNQHTKGKDEENAAKYKRRRLRTLNMVNQLLLPPFIRTVTVTTVNA